jgi:V/A-type H+-transporting ATPase subunit D
MPRLALNKTSLTRESRQLDTFERFLPSLDLKRRQLIAERNKARRDVVATTQDIEGLERSSGQKLPMAADARLDLNGLVTVRNVEIGQENLVGLRLPVLADVSLDRVEFAFLARPHWVDALADLLEELLRMRVRLQVKVRRLEILEGAVKKTTQRVNLFDKVLIPKTRNNIRRIRIKLSDAEKAAVVNAKIAKRKRAAH